MIRSARWVGALLLLLQPALIYGSPAAFAPLDKGIRAFSRTNSVPKDRFQAQRNADQSSFQDFLNGFPSIKVPLSIPLGENASKRFLLTGVLKKISDNHAQRYLVPFLPNFNTESTDDILKNFNFPDFKSNDYYYYVRPNLELDAFGVVFYLYNNFSSYFGLITYTKDGRFVDQLFIAGREGGSGAMYTLEALVYPNRIIELVFERTSWGKNLQHSTRKIRKYKIRSNGRIVMLEP